MLGIFGNKTGKWLSEQQASFSSQQGRTGEVGFQNQTLFRKRGIPDEYGIKVARVCINRGVQKKIYPAGLIETLNIKALTGEK